MAAVAVPRVLLGWTADGLTLDSERLTFIQVARGMEYNGRTLSLVDLAPTMAYVASTAPVQLGHLSTGAFLDLWIADRRISKGPAGRPSVLSLADPTLAPFGESLLLLDQPQIHGTGLRYTVRIIDGMLPPSSGSCLLYVNAGDDRTDKEHRR
jgi:hypothetical protein